MPRGHKPNCKCAACDRPALPCEHCGKTGLRGKLGLGSHVHNKHNPRRRRGRKYHLVPDGTGFIRRALIEHTVSLQNISRFADTLQKCYSGAARVRHCNPRVREAREAVWDEQPYAWHQISGLSAPGNILATCSMLARKADVPTRMIITTLILYGIEHLAQELRATKIAPDPSGASIRKLVKDSKQPPRFIPETSSDS